MPVLIEGERIKEKEPNLVLSLVTSNPFIVKGAELLKNENKRRLNPKTDGKLLYVCQRERATVEKHQMEYLGSMDATTCNIVIFVSRTSGKVSCAHLDGDEDQIGGDECSILDMVKTFEDEEKKDGLDVHMAGGFLDEKGYSLKIITSFLSQMQIIPIDFHIKLFCVYNLNHVKENGFGAPKIRGIAIELKSGKVFPAEFEDRGPDFALRNGRYTSGSSLANIYDWKKDMIVIEPFEYGIEIKRIVAYLKLPDPLFLKYSSTSPEVEGPTFIQDSKGTMQFMLENSDWKAFFRGKSRIYKWDSESKSWKQM